MTTSPFEMLSAGDVGGVKDYVKSHPELINAPTFFAGGTLLHYAAAESSPEAIEALVSLGFDVDATGETYGDSALQAACANGKTSNVYLLLSMGARIDTSTSFRNPLFAAISGRHPETVRLLLQQGIDSSIRYTLEDGSIVDAIDFAEKRGADECLLVLKEFKSI